MPKKQEPVIVSYPGVLNGRPVFRGTRVQVEILFENLAEGYSVDDILAEFPTLDRSDVRTALLQASESLKEKAPKVRREDPPAAAHARAS